MSDVIEESCCFYCGGSDLSVKPAEQYPGHPEKVDIYCSKCGYICTGTIVSKDIENESDN